MQECDLLLLGNFFCWAHRLEVFHSRPSKELIKRIGNNIGRNRVPANYSIGLC